MPLYRYAGVDRKNKNVQGEIWAESKQELQEELQVFGIFLISWNIVESSPLKPASSAPSKEFSNDSDAQYETRELGETGKRRKIKWLPRTPLHYFFLLMAIVAGIVVGQLVYSPHPAPTFLDAPPEVRSLLAKVKPGSTREQVEKILTHKDTGNQFDMITRYTIPPATWAWVSYDQTGGPWSPSNRVISWPYVSNSRSPSGSTKK